MLITPLDNKRLFASCGSELQYNMETPTVAILVSPLLSESGEREQRQPVAGSHRQESGDRREGGGKWGHREGNVGLILTVKDLTESCPSPDLRSPVRDQATSG